MNLAHTKIKIAVAGSTGFAGQELLKILTKHPKVEVKCAKGSDFEATDATGTDVIFLAVPKDKAILLVQGIKGKIIDLSPAHRFDASFVYGLPEANSDQIQGADKIANPGCYATACILGVLPLLSEQVQAVTFDCKSGYSGGGKSNPYDHEENVIPYSLAGHYHEPEIAKFLSTPFSFAPHVVNAFRGLIATIHIFGVSDPNTVQEIYEAHFQGKKLVKLQNEPPTFKQVAGTPYCLMHVVKKPNSIVVVSAIDNLLKGAASQAVQNMNLAFGFEETLGLLGG
ncbi:MAG: Asd/ArgC dimerization domain-containing protein [Candidatus Micrarchaeota archaeon]|nr:Asd/ArgC dimerization domain-containing protein [Candidatus Micrarchaeota archaeon]